MDLITARNTEAFAASAPRSRLRRAISGLIALLLFALLFSWIGGVTRLDLDKPLAYAGDSLEMLAYYDADYIHNEIDTRLHAPFELEHPQGWHYLFNALFQSNSNLIWASWLLAGGNDVRALNIAYLATFLLAFAIAYWVCGRLGLRGPFRFGAACLYALMPYHFQRGLNHFWESSYYLTPLLALIIMRIWSARPLGHRWNQDSWEFTWSDRRAWFAIVVLVFLSSFHPYHQFFFACLAASVAPLAAMYRRSWRPLLVGLFLAGLAVGVMFAKDTIIHLLVAPDLAFAINGQAISGYGEAEAYPLKLAQLVLPVEGHRWDLLAKLRYVYDSANPLNNENSSTTLGFIGALGLFAALALALTPVSKWRMSRVGKMGVITLIAILFAMMGGISSLISTASLALFGPHFSLTQMRGWNRMVVFIAFFAYFAAFWFLGEGVKQLRRRYVSAVPFIFLAGPMVGIVLAFALWDAVPGPIGQAAAAPYTSDQRFFAEMEEALPAGSRVLQLPFLIHHETMALQGVYYTDALRPFINTKTLHFTYGGDSGSEQAHWLKSATELPSDQAAPYLCRFGFLGVLLQRNMVKDVAAVERPWTTLLGAPLYSDDGNFSFFNLRSFCSDHGIAVMDLGETKRHLGTARKNGTRIFAPGDLPRNIGHLHTATDGTIRVAADTEEEGYLAYGPVEDLRDGSYVVTYSLIATNVAAGDKPLRFDVAAGSSATPLVATEHQGSTDGPLQLRLQFDTKDGRMFQYRFFKPRGYSVELNTIEVERAGK